MNSVQLFLILLAYQAHSLSVKDIKERNEKVYYNISEAKELFDDYIGYFKKIYQSKEEYENRLEIFTSNLKIINHHNTLGDTIFGLNEFTDLNSQELIQGGCSIPIPKTLASPEDLSNQENIFPVDYLQGVPAVFDWVTLGKVTRVKQQGRCGCCWAFAAVGALEGYYARLHNQLIEFSEQEILDCSQGGNDTTGYEGLALNNMALFKYGIMTAASYPFVGRMNSYCAYKANQAVFYISGSRQLVRSIPNEEMLKYYVYTNGPLVAGIVATDAFQHYDGSIASARTLACPPVYNGTNHAVLIVGYNTIQGIPVWIIKNSYGTGWGRQGFMFLTRNENACGIMDQITWVI